MRKSLVIYSCLLLLLSLILTSCQQTTGGATEINSSSYPISESPVEVLPTIQTTLPPYPIVQQPEASVTEIPDVVVPTPGKDTGVVTGQMVYTDSNKPVSNQYIYLGFKIFLTPGPNYTYGITQHGSPRTISDNNGRFALGDVPPGNYIILLWSLSGASVATEPGESLELEITVKPGELLDLGTIEVPPIGSQ